MFTKRFYLTVFASALIAGFTVYYINLQGQLKESGVEVEQNKVEYTFVHLYKDEVNREVIYPVITAGASREILEKINNEIRENVKYSCFGLPDDEDSLESLKVMYSHATGNSNDVFSYSYEELRKRLIDEYGYTSFFVSEVDFADKGIFSYSFNVEGYCGGAHPFSDFYAKTFDLKTGNVVEEEEMFNNKTYAFNETVFKYADNALRTMSEGNPSKCNYYDDFKGETLYPDITFSVSESGLKLQSFGYPYVLRFCEPAGGVTVPYDVVRSYIKKESILSIFIK